MQQAIFGKYHSKVRIILVSTLTQRGGRTHPPPLSGHREQHRLWVGSYLDVCPPHGGALRMGVQQMGPARKRPSRGSDPNGWAHCCNRAILPSFLTRTLILLSSQGQVQLRSNPCKSAPRLHHRGDQRWGEPLLRCCRRQKRLLLGLQQGRAARFA